MRIKSIDFERILFDNGNEITYDHEQSCCESNYADFDQIVDFALEIDFDRELMFKEDGGAGFSFWSKNTPSFFIPCYSSQNGYYTSDLTIYYNGVSVLDIDCPIIE